jgi:hypothetical protein
MGWGMGRRSLKGDGLLLFFFLLKHGFQFAYSSLSMSRKMMNTRETHGSGAQAA